MSFSIVGKSLSGATLYEVQENAPKNISDTTFTYTGVAQKIGVALNGAALDDDNWTVKYYNAAGNTPVANGDTTPDANTNLPINAGDYIAVVSGRGGLRLRGLRGPDQVLRGQARPLLLRHRRQRRAVRRRCGRRDGHRDHQRQGAVRRARCRARDLLPRRAHQDRQLQAVVAPEAGNAQAAANIAGSKTVSYNVVTNDQIVVQYNNAAWEETYGVDLSKGGSFSTSAIKVYAGKTQGSDVVPDGAALTAGPVHGHRHRQGRQGRAPPPACPPPAPGT